MISYEFNGTRLTFNKSTGALVSLINTGCGEILKGGRGLIDLAWPLAYDYEILRAGVRGSGGTEPEFLWDGENLTLRFKSLNNNLGITLPELDGGISAEVHFRPSKDGRSIILKCSVENHSDTPVRQVIFPDFDGLVPIAGQVDTRFTTMGATDYPFLELSDTPDNRRGFFATNKTVCGKFYRAGSYFDQGNMIGRYYDYGGLNGGISLYHRWWGYGPDDMEQMGRGDVTWVKFDHLQGCLRIGSLHGVDIGKGERYEGQEYVLTAHSGGWVQGIAPYREWVDAHRRRTVPQPRKIREALGFRTIWETEQYPNDPDAVKFTFDQLTDVGQDMLDHGLTELSIWSHGDFCLPYSEKSFHPQLGGFDGWVKNVKKLKAMGVDVVPFVSFISIWRPSAARYGLDVDGPEAGWAQNIKAIPAFQTPYIEKYKCKVIDQKDALWQQDVLDSLRFLRDKAGAPSIGWDQYLIDKAPGSMQDIIETYRKETTQMYPDASFSGESTFYFEADIDHLDYTWVWEYWPGTGDCRPYIHVVGDTIRPNMNIDNHPLHVKFCFMDNILMNLFPSRVDDTNGSALIGAYPELSSTLKQCALLRRRYMDWFTKGQMLGDCVLGSPCANARVTGYAGEEGLLIFVVKLDDAPTHLEVNLGDLPGTLHTLVIRDIDGKWLLSKPLNDREVLTIEGAKESLWAIEIS